nr:leucyl aminopeptidase [Campylobacter sp.]
MKFQILNKKINEIKADYELVFIINKNLKHKFIKDKQEFKFYDFKGDGVLNLTSKKRIYIGIKSLDEDEIRKGIAKALNLLSNLNIKSIKISSYINQCTKSAFRALAEGFVLGSYKFEKYKSEKNPCKISEICISTDEFGNKEVDLFKANLGLNQGQIIANATNF